MKVKEAAHVAKQHIADLFSEEGAEHIGLEEIEFDPTSQTWGVTIGFFRPSYATEVPIPQLPSLFESRKRIREMKVVTVNDSTGEPLAVRNRE